MYNFKRIGMNEIEIIKELFINVFTREPWNDEWSNQEQLDLYLFDLVGQNNSLTYGLFEDEQLVGVAMGILNIGILVQNIALMNCVYRQTSKEMVLGHFF